MFKTGLSGLQLKILAASFMLIDHLNTHFGRQLHWPLWVNLLGRFVAPLFVFLLVEGFTYTHSKSRYLRRLSLGAVVMIGLNVAHNWLTHNYLDPLTGHFSWYLLFNGNNIFLTLTLLFALIWLIDSGGKQSGGKRVLCWLSSVLLIPVICLTEGGLYLLPVALLFYWRKKSPRPKLADRFYLLFCLLLLGHTLSNYSQLSGVTLYQQLTFDSEFMLITALPLIWLYNGKRGGHGRAWEKNFFYLFYPLHLALIYLIEAL